MTTGSTEERPGHGTYADAAQSLPQAVPRPGTHAHPAAGHPSAPSPALTRAAAGHRGALRHRGAVPLGAADMLSAAAVVLAFGGHGSSDAGPLLLGPLGCGVLVLGTRAGLYRPGLDPHALDELPLLASRVALAWCLTTALFAASGKADSLRWSVLLVAVAAHTAVSCAARALVLAWLRGADRRAPRAALVVGSDGTALAVARVLADRPRYGLRPVGFVELGTDGAKDTAEDGAKDTAKAGGKDGAKDAVPAIPADAAVDVSTAPAPAQGPAPGLVHDRGVPDREVPEPGSPERGPGEDGPPRLPHPLHAAPQDVARAVVLHTVSDAVFLRTPWEEPHGAELAALLGERGVTGWLIRPGCALGAHGTHAHGAHATGPAHVWGFSCRRLVLDCPATSRSRRKRLLDLLLVVPALLCAAPVLAVCALAVRLSDGRGVLFRQERIGFGGHPFTLLKFRTLRPSDDQESATRWSVAGDERMSVVGRVLRRTSLDELPQLWNVLRGDMSLVGPRPERPFFVRQFSQSHPGYEHRHRAPAGLTGLAQVHGLRGDTSIEERARFDNHYIETWSLWEDVRIMCRTLTSFFRMDGR